MTNDAYGSREGTPLMPVTGSANPGTMTRKTVDVFTPGPAPLGAIDPTNEVAELVEDPEWMPVFAPCSVCSKPGQGQTVGLQSGEPFRIVGAGAGAFIQVEPRPTGPDFIPGTHFPVGRLAAVAMIDVCPEHFGWFSTLPIKRPEIPATVGVYQPMVANRRAAKIVEIFGYEPRLEDVVIDGKTRTLVRGDQSAMRGFKPYGDAPDAVAANLIEAARKLAAYDAAEVQRASVLNAVNQLKSIGIG